MTTERLATLLKIILPNNAGILRYQNYQIADLTYLSETYPWAGFSVGSWAETDLNLSSTDTTITLRNSSTLQDLLRQYNDLKGAIVFIYLVRIPSMVGQAFPLILSHKTIEGGAIIFTARSATNASQGELVTAKIDAQVFPEIPFYRPQL